MILSDWDQDGDYRLFHSSFAKYLECFKLHVESLQFAGYEPEPSDWEDEEEDWEDKDEEWQYYDPEYDNYPGWYNPDTEAEENAPG